MSTIEVLIVSLVAGLHRSCWGAYKDSPYENFSIFKFLRSILVAVFCGLLLSFLPHFVGKFELWTLFVSVVAIDTVLWEIYKMFFREESQAKYKIPSTFHLLNRKVESRPKKMIFGIGMLLFVFLFVIWSAEWKINNIFMALVVAVVVGWVEAIGGAWKDAPFEGFEFWKLFRSPVVALVVGILLFVGGIRSV